jgi:putative endonuclease
MRKKYFAIYIISNQNNGTIYIGVTSDLTKRIYEHKNGLIDGFSKKYGLKNLVYYELHESPESAIHRESRLKRYSRKVKLALIEKENPDWLDLYDRLF